MELDTFQPIGNSLIPFVGSTVSAGFPSPADDYLEPALDLNQYLIKNPEATFLVRVSGDSMIQAGVFAGDVLIVDRSLSAVSGDIVIAVVNREFLVKKILISPGQVILRSANSRYADLIISQNLESSNLDFEIWGVVTCCLHTLKRN